VHGDEMFYWLSDMKWVIKKIFGEDERIVSASDTNIT
jgi:hypothetical protein